MAYRKKTLRSMSPTTRRYARLVGQLEGLVRQAKKFVETMRELELDSRALHNMNARIPRDEVDPESIEAEFDRQALSKATKGLF